MLNNWQVIPSPGQYEDALSDLLIRTETRTHTSPDYSAYLDSRGFLSIGIGFNLTESSVADAVYAALGLVQDDPRLNPQLQAVENQYISQLNDSIDAGNAVAFNAALATRAANRNLTAVLGHQMSTLRRSAMRTKLCSPVLAL
jgi:hypothetical protein